MTSRLSRETVTAFRDWLQSRAGLRFEDAKLAQLEEVLAPRLAHLGLQDDAYLARLASADHGRDELRELAPQLTVTETYFFRSSDQLRAFAEFVVAARLRAASPGRLAILSAGCASGEEPYSLAIRLREHPRVEAFAPLTIHAVDLNRAMLKRAGAAIYSPWALRETPDDVRARWFTPRGADFVLDPAIRRMVTFSELNVADDSPSFWHAGRFDVVFLRNVLMYFTPETARAAIARVAASLAPGGFLFLGHAETLRGHSEDFDLRRLGDAFYYQLRAPHERASVPSHAPAQRGCQVGAGSWVDTIREASERVRDLTRASSGDPTPTPWDRARAIALIAVERHADARALLAALSPGEARSPDALLLRAVLLSHGGDLEEAESVCAELLTVDAGNAAAHYLTALCREHAGDVIGAAEHDQVAIGLDPRFAMPHLHLGLLARKRADLETARRAITKALTLLDHEHDERVTLFGGGFTREALICLCQAELSSPRGALR